jgi:hypothetical protein
MTKSVSYGIAIIVFTMMELPQNQLQLHAKDFSSVHAVISAILVSSPSDAIVPQVASMVNQKLSTIVSVLNTLKPSF